MEITQLFLRTVDLETGPAKMLTVEIELGEGEALTSTYDIIRVLRESGLFTVTTEAGTVVSEPLKSAPKPAAKKVEAKKPEPVPEPEPEPEEEDEVEEKPAPKPTAKKTAAKKTAAKKSAAKKPEPEPEPEDAGEEEDEDEDEDETYDRAEPNPINDDVDDEPEVVDEDDADLPEPSAALLKASNFRSVITELIALGITDADTALQYLEPLRKKIPALVRISGDLTLRVERALELLVEAK